jgi:hypothetical protein
VSVYFLCGNEKRLIWLQISVSDIPIEVRGGVRVVHT